MAELVYPDVTAAVTWLVDAFGVGVRSQTVGDVAPEDWGGTTGPGVA